MAKTAADLRAEAAHMRQFALTVTDPDVLAEINFMIDEWQRRARLLDNGGAESSGDDPRQRIRGVAIQSALSGRAGYRVMQPLYDSEINFVVSSFYDDGFRVKLGDELHGFCAEAHCTSWAEVEGLLAGTARIHYPTSVFATSR